ncbi:MULTISPECIES: hypothetical protein [Aeromonas]|uniref:hypothetical protein n=1 Tax=Aeromonas TaxID=642 RepID=UPI00191E777C|nr:MULTISPECIES: hypothetical protein [Aeromonas]MBL0600512.1 hypothetical protein [Aeromonas dhakensis]MBS4711996.1 hypothetical protein [Aeromonas caviae]MDM5056377.1 hypothetical protein [Aeromonas dhakensis]MDM5082509.1 hypothetical protein [Aeromonas dhakensis]
MNNDQKTQKFVAYLQEGANPFRNEEQRRNKDRIDQVLRAFVYMVAHDITPPPAVMAFIASGVKLHLDGSQSPWPTNNKRKISANLVALIQVADALHPGHRADIAAHAEVSARQVGNYLDERGIDITAHRHIYHEMYKGQDLVAVLNAISDLKDHLGKGRK